MELVRASVIEGRFSSIGLLILAFLLLYVLVKLLPPWKEARFR